MRLSLIESGSDENESVPIRPNLHPSNSWNGPSPRERSKSRDKRTLTGVTRTMSSRSSTRISAPTSPRTPRLSPHNSGPLPEGGRARSRSRSRSPSSSPRPSPHLRRKSSHWDFDLMALENTIDSMDTNNPEFAKTGCIFMAARWRHIRAIRNVIGGEEWVYRSDWVAYWGSSETTDAIGEQTAGKLFDCLVDKRHQGRVSMRDIDYFAKQSQRLWRDLAAKGEKALQKFSWWEEQQDLQLQRNFSLDITDAKQEEDTMRRTGSLEERQHNAWERRARSESKLAETKIEQMVQELRRVRAEYEREINELMDKNANLVGENAELKERCRGLELELNKTRGELFCNIPEHQDDFSPNTPPAIATPTVATPSKKMLPRSASLRMRTTSSDLFADLKMDEDEDDGEDGVKLAADELMIIKRSIGQVQVEANWLEAGEIAVDVDVAASLFDSQKRFVRHVMWGPRADRSYRRGIITLHEDVRSGGDEGEKMDIFLDRMPIDIQYIVITTTIFQGATSFQDVAVCDVKVRGQENSSEEELSICHFKLSGSSGRDCNAVIMAFFQRNYDESAEHEWSFHAVGRNANGTKVADIAPAIQDLINEQS